MIDIIFFILIISFFWIVLGRLESVTTVPKLAIKHESPQLRQALSYAERLYTEKHYVTAEKAYVAVLKLDHRNLQAYNRLGIIYSAQKNYKEAIQCFEVAARFVPSATTLFNLGLAFYENHNYVKAIATIKKSIMFEPSVARFVALAKAYDKIADVKGKLDALESAVAIEPHRQLLIMLRDGYRQAGRKDQLLEVTERLKQLSAS
jgi:tetratricopeptide (TPR) repeat protein